MTVCALPECGGPIPATRRKGAKYCSVYCGVFASDTARSIRRVFGRRKRDRVPGTLLSAAEVGVPLAPPPSLTADVAALYAAHGLAVDWAAVQRVAVRVGWGR